MRHPRPGEPKPSSGLVSILGIIEGSRSAVAFCLIVACFFCFQRNHHHDVNREHPKG